MMPIWAVSGEDVSCRRDSTPSFVLKASMIITRVSVRSSNKAVAASGWTSVS